MAELTRRQLLAGASASALAVQAATAQITRAVSAEGGGIGYTSVVTMFGTARYNADASITGTPNGPIFTYNPDAPDSHTTAINEGNFVSDFAGFTQGSMHCRRDDTPLRIYFRKDVSPDPARIEIIVELGHFTTNGSAANLGPFMLQIYKGGVAQGIPQPYFKPPDPTKAYFPQLGWFTRWRWNPTPRAVIRSGQQLLSPTSANPHGLKLVPNFSNSLATEFRCPDCGTSGGTLLIRKYCSNYDGAHSTPTSGGVVNPTGVNENCTLRLYMPGTGGAAEISVVPEWNANWVCNGNAAALTASLVLGEVDGGIPWCMRDSSTNWAPIDFFGLPNLGMTTKLDRPSVKVPSAGADWDPDVAHHPCLSFVPYLITGDPFFLENLQFVASWTLYANGGNRAAGLAVNNADLNSPMMPGSPQDFASFRYQTRSFAWTIRTNAAAYIATPASVPSWLLPKAYWKRILDQNGAKAQSWGPDYPRDHSSLTQYPLLHDHLGELVCQDFEEGFMLAYLMFAIGLAVNQGGLTSWLPYAKFMAKMPLAWANADGTSGWDNHWPIPYLMWNQAFSTDYLGSPRVATFADLYELHKNSAFLPQFGYWWTIPAGSSGDNAPFHSWAPSTLYKCNSWMVEVRAGCPLLPNVNDALSLTISGSFPGSPVTVTHTVSSADIDALRAGILSGPFGNFTHPITTELISKFNTALARTGIMVTEKCIVPGVGTFGSGAYFNVGAAGRFYINFDSSTLPGGAVIVTGSYTHRGPNRASSLYIVPNGDGVKHGTDANLLGRGRVYQCGKTGTSAAGGGPTGSALQMMINDGSTNWCFTPELKSLPICVPGGPLDGYPSFGPGGIWGQVGQKAYIYYALGAMTGLQTAGVTGAAAAVTSLRGQIDYYWNKVDRSARGLWAFILAP